MMKRISILFLWSVMAALIALTACTRDSEPEMLQSDPVMFTAASDFSSFRTRAAMADMSTLKANGFYVYANATNGESEIKENFMNDQHVTWNGTRWTYSPTKVWPTNENATVDFYAVYEGASGDAVNINTQYDWYNKPQVMFYVNEVVSKQTDMLWAAPQLGSRRTSVNTPVKFTFKHALAGFFFTIKLASGDYTDYTVTVNSLKLKGYFAPKAQVMPDETDLKRAYRLMGDWIERTYTISKDGDDEINVQVSSGDASGDAVTTSEKVLTGDKGYIMVLPFGQQYTVELEYKVTGPVGTGVHSVSKTVNSADLAAGNMLKTLLILDPDLGITPGPGNTGDINLMVTLIDWQDVNAGEMQIEFE